MSTQALPCVNWSILSLISHLAAAALSDDPENYYILRVLPSLILRKDMQERDHTLLPSWVMLSPYRRIKGRKESVNGTAAISTSASLGELRFVQSRNRPIFFILIFGLSNEEMSTKQISNLYQNSKIREQSAPLLFSQLRNQNLSITLPCSFSNSVLLQAEPRKMTM